MNPTEVQWQIIQAYLVAGVIYKEYYFSDSGIWVVWIKESIGPIVCVYPDGKTRKARSK